MTVWLYFALTVLGWGLGIFLMKIATRSIDNFTAVVFNMPGYLMIGLLLAPKVRWSELHLGTGHLVAVAVGACYVIANWGFYRMCEGAPISILSPMSSLYMTVPIILGAAFLGERPTPVQMLGILLAMVAVVLLAWPTQPRPV